MASLTPISQSHPVSKSSVLNHRIPLPRTISCSARNPILNSTLGFGKNLSTGHLGGLYFTQLSFRPAAVVVAKATAEAAAEKRKKEFVEEMRGVAMRLHTRDQAKEGEKKSSSPEETSPAKWDPSVEGYLRFLVDSKVVYEVMEGVVEEAKVPYYAEFRNTGLERTESLNKDLEWFKEQGYAIPEPSTPGLTYASYLEELSEKDPQAFICHFYNVYFAHTAGGRMIGKKIVTCGQNWSREEKNHCLEETEKSFKYSGDILRLILS